ncbi:hypothetical protein [Achromobacter marplatensis]|uniref:hypothetical protein n=1 Tax=Achromobacter marplatensis TaxID=470868 RepID=UPI000277FA02|nr:hypothetical protein [Achromobacter marplatensis]EJO27519.1 hypothetical protein QWC_31428 [Achromobacter marplatensis]
MQVDLKKVELRALWNVLNDHKYMVKAIMTDTEISDEIKEAESTKHKEAQKVLRKLYAAHKAQAPRRPVRSIPHPRTDGGGRE